jgi:PAS domain S-box-containing protein
MSKLNVKSVKKSPGSKKNPHNTRDREKSSNNLHKQRKNSLIPVKDSLDVPNAGNKNEENEQKNVDILDKLNEAQQIAKIGNWDWDLITNKVWWSDELYRIFDLEKGVFVPDFEANAKYVHPDDIDSYRKEVERIIRAHQSMDYDLRLISGKGITKYCNMKGKVNYSDSGQPLRFFGTFLDITEKKRIEEELLLNRNMLQKIIDTIPQSVFWKDINSIYLGCNEVFAHELGLDGTKQIIGKTDYDITRKREDADSYRADDKDVLENNKPKPHIIEQMERSNGKRIWVDTTKVPLNDEKGDVFGLLGIYEDITERKITEEKIRENEKRYRTLFTEMLEGFALHEIICDAVGNPVDYRFLDINPAFEKLTGLKSEDTIGKTVRSVLPNIEYYWIEKYGKVALTGESISFENYSGEIDRYYSVVAFSPEYGKFATLFEDITDRKRSEILLSQEKERLAVTLRSIGDGVITTDLNGNVVIINRAAEELTGWKLEEAKGRPLNEVFHIINEGTRLECENPVKKVLESGHVVELANHTVLINKNGHEYIIADSGAPIKDKESNTVGVVLVFRDITEKQKLLENIQRTDKLESIGILAGGIAHDFNNLLSGIYGFIELAIDECPEISPVKDYLNKSMKTFERAKDLTQQLLTFAKGGSPLRKIVPLLPLLRENSLFALSGSNVSCIFDVGENIWLCDIDENQISQVINNIVLNAQQSMPLGGKIVISAQNIEISGNDFISLNPGKYVKISVVDSGVGIPASILPRIFDPFFTTKQKGNGLGLATAYSIIKKHDGEITVHSIPDNGTTFHIYLPASEQTDTIQVKNKTDVHSGLGNVLLMDDEEVIKETVSAMLTGMGYNVIYARDGNEALKMIKESMINGDGFIYAIFDLTIPGGVGGKETIKKLREFNKDLMVFVSSGYSEDPVMANPKEYDFTDKISKPFRKSELAELMNRYFSNNKQ